MTYIEQRIEALEQAIIELELRIDALERGELPEWLSTGQAAKVLDVHVNTIKNWIAAGKIPAVRMGRNWRIAKADVLAMLEKTS